ncbi:rhomboid family intramembrane serine protease [Neolewinella aurantiaca]|uniref:Rhomboid family intramembrane serine protease n=1 Tax=Neolewinella aurantiaca TaxID=2602767 RepID=A0A5C7FGK1_9BACT|nr:rhomboid family intramembrane serine protease [Neolewinella aurantiaca]TXF88833.1 rhomboid family intramembrane serine protease [Neolewinella aurantiaca]
MPPVTPIVKSLLILNFLVFAVVYLPGEMGYDIDIAKHLSLYYPGGDTFKPYQLVSHFFMHADITHIAFNMLSLYFLGPIVETRLGAKRFLFLYLVAALGAAGLHSLENWYQINKYQDLAAAFQAAPSLKTLNAFFDSVNTGGLVNGSGRSLSPIIGKLQNQMALGQATPDAISQSYTWMLDYVKLLSNGQPVLGASGAVSGVAAAFAVLFPWQKLQILFIPIGIYAAYLIPVFFLIDLILGVLKLEIDNIAHFAHVGGAITGALIAFYFAKTTLPPWMKRADPNA